MNISIVCSDAAHPIMPALQAWQREQSNQHTVELMHNQKELLGGDILFLVSCCQVIGRETRNKFSACLVLHASDLPQGRGWSPHVWTILNGGTEITVTLLEAVDSVDAGPIWLKERFHLEGHELLPEINEKLFRCELSLMSRALEIFDTITPVPQLGEPGPYLRRRSPQDSRLDVNRTLAEQFNLLRVVDSDRFPAFFEFRGHRYVVKIEKGT
jgi:methionyl-tRNA formyltransferase